MCIRDSINAEYGSSGINAEYGPFFCPLVPSLTGIMEWLSSKENFQSLVINLLSGDNEIRGKAENIFNETKKYPDQLSLALLQSMATAEEHVRSFCAVLLRRVLLKGNPVAWTSLNPATQQTIKAQLLQALEHEPATHVQKKICDTVSDLAVVVVPEGQWNDLLGTLFQWSRNPKDTLRVCSLSVFSDLSQYVAPTMKQHFATLQELLQQALQDPFINVRIAAVTATASVMTVLETNEEKERFRKLLPMMLDCVSKALNEKKEQEARDALEVFVEVAEAEPNFLRPYVVPLIEAMFQIAGADTLEPETRHMAVEFILTLAENKPGMVRKIPSLVDRFLPICLRFMMELDEAEDWYNQEDDEDDEELTNKDFGEEAIDRFALSMGGKAIAPSLFNLIPTLLLSQDWKQRHAGIMSIALVGEGCSKFIGPHLENVLKYIIPGFTDPHPRVRWAACNAAGQMATDFTPDFQQKAHQPVLNGVMTVMSDLTFPRVVAHAASSIINFCEGCDPELLAPYVDGLLAKLFSLLGTGHKMVQEQSVTAVAAIADCIKEKFTPYYETFMPYMIRILAEASGKNYRTLRGKSIECISILALAVGKEKFLPDSPRVMELLMRLQNSELEPDDPQISFLLQSCARLCTCLSEHFVPYLGAVMPPLLKSAQIQPDVKVTEDFDDQEPKDEEEGWDYIPIQDKRIGIRTSTLEEKATACNMILCYVAELKEGFFPYVDQVAQILVPLLKFYYHDGCRMAAVTTMPELLRSVSIYVEKKGADRQLVKTLFDFIFNTLIQVIPTEIELEILTAMLESVSQILDIIGENNIIDPPQVKQTIDAFKVILDDFGQRRENREEKGNEPDFDDEEAEKLEEENEQEEEFLSQVGEVMGKFCKLYKAHFLPFFSELVVPIAGLLAPTRPSHDRQIGLCIFDDLVEHCGPETIHVFPQFWNAMVKSLEDPDPSVRQAASYGVGVCAVVVGSQIGSAIQEVVPRLTTLINHPASREEENAYATENGISSLGKICKHLSQFVNTAELLPLWLSWFPVQYDKVESVVIYGLLCDFIESNNQHLLGVNGERVPRIIALLFGALGTDLVNDELNVRLANIIAQMSRALPALFQNHFNSLDQETKNRVQPFLASVASASQ
eukprot:TRINITY_DN1575_c0_g1_i1.p1 TRINITY_DN1575_c0_g1~~TRINITY_DN1575_c0_g1_i1.p1  ORF type:complete len:1131 (+),score=337.45 TRINITY_DN1575_c0_g1_i1:1-3393(+)